MKPIFQNANPDKREMELKTVAGVIVFSLCILTIALLIPEQTSLNNHGLPWQIEQTDNSIRVFGLTIGKSTVSDAENIFQGKAEINLFENRSDQFSLEAYFDKVELGGLTAKVILVLDFSVNDLNEIYQRGVRISKIASGSDKVDITSTDLQKARNTQIASITYIPQINLTAAQLETRFGKAEKIIQEPDSTAQHWLYPKLGLDVTLDENAKEILQYVAPSHYSIITQPLLQQAAH